MWKKSHRYQHQLVLCLSMRCMAYWYILLLNLVYRHDILEPCSLLSIKGQVSILQIHSDELVRKEKRIEDWFLTIHWFRKDNKVDELYTFMKCSSKITAMVMRSYFWVNRFIASLHLSCILNQTTSNAKHHKPINWKHDINNDWCFVNAKLLFFLLKKEES